MNKILLVLLSILLVFLLALSGILLYIFSPSGNAMMKDYIKEELELKTGMPVEVKKFNLDVGKSRVILTLNKQANVEVVTHFDILAQSFRGIYQVNAQEFHYEKMVLKDVALRGKFEGVAEDVLVTGKGRAVDANLAYRLRVLDKNPQNIEFKAKGAALTSLLELVGQPPLAKGRVDVDINMPDIGEEFANGYGKIVLHKALFDTKIVQKLYALALPEKSHALANMDIKLKGNTLNVFATATSNLFNLKIENAHIGLKDKNMSTSYFMDVKEMAILSENRLSGPLKILGEAQINKEGKKIQGATHSLGGKLLFDIGETSKVHFENLKIENILRLIKQEPYATGLLSGSGDIDKSLTSGRYDVKVNQGIFNAKSIEKKFGYQIPVVNQFTLNSEGTVASKILESTVTLKSSISDMELTEIVYDIEKKKMDANYDLFLPNIGLLIPDNKAVKRGYMSLKGEVAFDKTLRVQGSTKGLGEKLDFVYDSKSATVDAHNLFVEKLLSLAGLPRYVKGKLSTKVNLNNIKEQDGTFEISGNDLVTQSKAMEKLIDKKLEMKLALKSKGKVNNGVVYANTKINTSMGKVTLSKTRYDTKKKVLKSQYHIDIADLQKATMLIDKKLYGPMLLEGDIVQDSVLTLKGHTETLGGKIDYKLVDNTLTSTITKVPLENILGLLGHDKIVQGDAYGQVNFDTKAKKGTVDIDIKSFQIKPSSTTDTVKMFIGKDPARIIYSSTKLHADIKGKVTEYTLSAEGSRSTIHITQGKIDKVNDTHTAKIKFVYEKYVITGSIVGTADNPKVVVDPSAIMQSKAGEKIQENLDKALGGDMGKAVGGFLKGFKF